MNKILAPPGTFRNPADRYCFLYCGSCGRCSQKGKYAACAGCSGRIDEKGQRVPDRDDYCRCAEGILQWTTQEGRHIQVRFLSDPFKGAVKYQNISQDEADWESYLNDMREKYNDPNFNPIQITEG